MTLKLLTFLLVITGMLYLWERPLPAPLGAYRKQPGLTLFSRKQSEISKKTKDLERELMVLKQDQRPVGMDHIQRMWKDLLGLWKKGALSKKKAMDLYQMLIDVYGMSNPRQAAVEQPAHGDAQGNTGRGTAENAGTETSTADVRQEIDRIAATPSTTHSGLAPAHYDRLKKGLDELASQGVTGLERYYQILEERSPYAVAAQDKKQEAAMTADTERKKREQDPYYDCPKDTAPPMLTADFTDFSSIQTITPPGTPTGDRDVAKGHFWIWTGGKQVPLYVPVDAVFESMTSGPASATDPTVHYRMDFKVQNPCGYRFRFAHVSEPDTSLQPGAVLSVGTRVGYTVGNIKSGNWDIGFYNMLQEGELAKINAFGLGRYGVCLLDYYPSEKRAAYRALLDPTGPRRVCQY